MAKSEALLIYTLEDIVDIFQYLDALKKEGTTNMFGAPDFLVKQFGLSKEKSEFFAKLWMQSYDDKINVGRRARTVFVAHGGVI